MGSKITGDLTVTGTLVPTTFVLPSASVTNSSVAVNAAIAASKLQHIYKASAGDPVGTTATSKTFTLFVASGTATVDAFHCGVYTAPTGGGTETITIDLKKNGSSILSTTVSFTDSDSDRTIKDGSLSSTSLVADDWLTMVVTVSGSGGTQGLGVFGWAQVDEADNE